MSKRYRGGFISATPPTTTVSSASGIWTLEQVSQNVTGGVWPRKPGTPTIGTATAVTPATATVAFTAPSDLGSGAITYTATSSPSGLTGTGASPITVSGLTPVTAYTFTVTATTGGGTSAASAASNSITTPALVVPSAPTIGTATQTGSSTATVAYTAPASNGGSTITSYTATSSPGGITGTLSQAGSGTITVSGLSSSTAYTFTVTATNAIGTSAASAASSSITTAAPPQGQQNYTTSGTYSWVAPPDVTSISVMVVGGGGPGHSSRGSNVSGSESRFQFNPHAGGGERGRDGSGGAGGLIVSGLGFSGGSGSYPVGQYTAGPAGGAGYLTGQSPMGAGSSDGWTTPGGSGAGLYGGYNIGYPASYPYSGNGGNYGGGGGGGRDGGGGGGGATAYTNNISVTPGTSYSLVVGSGGNYVPSGTDNYAGHGSVGAVRIIWGIARSYPSTNIGNV